MGDERYTTQRTTSSQHSNHSTTQHQTYAASRAKLLFGCYRRGDANDPDIYVAAMAAVLARYDADLIREVTDPNTGIQTREKFMTFMPNAGELKVHCEAVAAHRDRLQKLGSLPRVDFSLARLPRPKPAAGDLATVFVPAANPRYGALVEWSKTGDPRKWKFEPGRSGIYVAYDVWDQRMTATRKLSDVVETVIAEAAE